MLKIYAVKQNTIPETLYKSNSHSQTLLNRWRQFLILFKLIMLKKDADVFVWIETVPLQLMDEILSEYEAENMHAISLLATIAGGILAGLCCCFLAKWLANNFLGFTFMIEMISFVLIIPSLILWMVWSLIYILLKLNVKDKQFKYIPWK